MQKSRLGHNLDEYYYAQFFSTFDIVNWIKLIEFDVVMSCKKDVSGDIET